MRIRRYKVIVTNSDGVVTTASFITQRAAAKYIDKWRTYMYVLYADHKLLDPCLFFALKKWDKESRRWDYVLTFGGRRFLEDLFLGRVKA